MMRPLTVQQDQAWLKELKGCTYKQKLVDQAFQYLIEEKKKAFAPLRGRVPSPETCLITVKDKRSQILDIGGSLPSDLILDNFGNWFQKLIRAPAADTNSVSLTDTGGTPRTFYILGPATPEFNASNNTGTRIQIGSSAVAVARGDYAIGTAFGTAPENAVFDTGTGSYGSGSIALSGTIAAGGAGTIRESVLIAVWFDTGNTSRSIALFHDATAATAFVAGNSITVTYTISL